jgi:predicted alpha-1,6-mannanase (GH76 family)
MTPAEPTLSSRRTRRRVLSVFALDFFIVLFCAGFAPVDTAPTAPNRMQQASFAIHTLQRWYVQQSGLYRKPTDWWNSANAITVLVDYSRVAHSDRYLGAVANTFQKASTAYHVTHFINDSNDDEGWWALAWIDAYDLTRRPEYLQMAETIFADLTTQWDTTVCGGGVWWSKDLQHSAYKNAVTNELFLTISASLANRVHNRSQHASYLAWAHREQQWFRRSGMINADNLVNDGLNATHPAACINNHQTTWTYNQGVILGGLAELYKADSDPALLAEARDIAHATIAHLTGTTGILQEPPGSGPDWPQFKGIFMRNLARLYQVAPDAEYRRFAEKNADSIWRNDRNQEDNGEYEFGEIWQGPCDSSDGTRQTSAADAFLAALEMQ